MSAMSWNRLRRKVVSGAVVAFCAAAVVLALIPLGFILFFVIGHGLPALSAAFFTQLPKPVGEPGGGMANAIAGTLILIGLAAGIAVPIGIVSGIYVSEYGKTSLASAVRFSADILNGVPSMPQWAAVHTWRGEPCLDPGRSRREEALISVRE